MNFHRIQKTVIYLLLGLLFSCGKPATESVEKAVIEGTSELAFDKVTLGYFSNYVSQPYIRLESVPTQKIELKIELTGPIFAELILSNENQRVVACPVYLEPGKTLLLEVGEKSVTYGGDLSHENEFLRGFRSGLVKDQFKYFVSNSHHDLEKIEASRQEKLQSISSLQTGEDFQSFLTEMIDYYYMSLKFAVLEKAETDWNNLPSGTEGNGRHMPKTG